MTKVLMFIKNKISFLAAVILASIVGGATTAAVMAAIPNSQTGEINACYRNQGGLGNPQGSLRAIDTQSGQNCAGNETPISWEQSFGKNHYRNLKFSIGTNDSETQALQLPLDTLVMSPTYATSINIDCGNGNTETLLPRSINSSLVLDTNNPSYQTDISVSGSGICGNPSNRELRIDIQVDADSITLTHNPASTLPLASPVSITMNLWY